MLALALPLGLPVPDTIGHAARVGASADHVDARGLLLDASSSHREVMTPRRTRTGDVVRWLGVAAARSLLQRTVRCQIGSPGNRRSKRWRSSGTLSGFISSS